MQKIKQLLPGLGVCLAISIPAWLLGKLVPVVGGAVFSILISMVVALFWSPKDAFKPGVTFVSKSAAGSGGAAGFRAQPERRVGNRQTVPAHHPVHHLHLAADRLSAAQAAAH